MKVSVALVAPDLLPVQGASRKLTLCSWNCAAMARLASGEIVLVSTTTEPS